MAAGSSGAVAAVYLCMVVLNLGPLFGYTTDLAPLRAGSSSRKTASLSSGTERRIYPENITEKPEQLHVQAEACFHLSCDAVAGACFQLSCAAVAEACFHLSCAAVAEACFHLPCSAVLL
ncbi:hypothetical protein NQZ68_038408 [Dissostichus eleginoides]|nr:hypothetical protein NQZ68_038408 [Dissostichus eleginoides]